MRNKQAKKGGFGKFLLSIILIYLVIGVINFISIKNAVGNADFINDGLLWILHISWSSGFVH